MTTLFTCSSPDGIRLHVERVAGSLAVTIADPPEACAIALSPQQSAQLSDALAGDLRERVRRICHAIDELRNPCCSTSSGGGNRCNWAAQALLKKIGERQAKQIEAKPLKLLKGATA